MTILHGDCLEVMREMEPDSVDLVFTSPPYENARTYGIDFNHKGGTGLLGRCRGSKNACASVVGLRPGSLKARQDSFGGQLRRCCSWQTCIGRGADGVEAGP